MPPAHEIAREIGRATGMIRPVKPQHADATRIQCMEVWGGNHAVATAVEVAGLDTWILSQPYEGDREGGDIHYVSTCGSGRVSRFVVADVSGHGANVGDLAQRLRGHPRLTVIESDVLKVDLVRVMHEYFAIKNEVTAGNVVTTGQTPKLRMVGNLPYNISTPILFHLLDFVAVIEDQQRIRRLARFQRPRRRKVIRFLDDALYRFALMLSAKTRDRAERALMVAAFAEFEVGRPGTSGSCPRCNFRPSMVGGSDVKSLFLAGLDFS